MGLQYLLAISVVLFSFGLLATLIRTNAIMVLIGVELMMASANLNFISFWRFGEHPQVLTGLMFVVFSIVVAAAEAAVGIAIIILLYRRFRSVDVDQACDLKG
jgi:NADH-quinone oxidoreductase subunit K